MRIKIDGENEVFIIADQTGLKFYNIGKIFNFLAIVATFVLSNSKTSLTQSRQNVGQSVTAEIL